MFRLLDYGLYQMYKTLGCVGMSYDVDENDKTITINVSVPGLKKEDIEVKVRDGRRLVLKSVKSSKYTPDFYYSFILPSEITKKGAIASLQDGVLTVKLEKKEGTEFKLSLE
jgi:HSP20 family molecular chaperone IbpA